MDGIIIEAGFDFVLFRKLLHDVKSRWNNNEGMTHHFFSYGHLIISNDSIFFKKKKRRAKLIQKLEHEEQRLAEIITRESALEAKKTKCILSLSLKVRGEKRKRVV